MSSTPLFAEKFTNNSATGMTQDQAYALVDAISEREDLAITAAAYELPDGSWGLETICQGEPDLESFSQVARLTLGGDITFSKERVDTQTDWVAQSQQGLAPVFAGGFYIHGSHDAHTVPTGARAIEVNAAQAFGTGHHETTTGCLQAIQELLRTTSPKHIIDVGTGTGVLAIALAKTLRRNILATDIDPVAVHTARQNAINNQVGKFIKPITATGLNHAKILHEAPYDLMVANILAKPLIHLAPDMAELAARKAHFILSGLLVSQAPRVISAYRDVGFSLQKRIERGDWATLILKR